MPPNVEIIKGWFSNTLPVFSVLHADMPIKLLHIDCDLYQSTIEALIHLNWNIRENTIIVFDELGNWPEGKQWYNNWREGEWKALNDWLYICRRKAEALGRDKTHCASIKVIEQTKVLAGQNTQVIRKCAV